MILFPETTKPIMGRERLAGLSSTGYRSAGQCNRSHDGGELAARALDVRGTVDREPASPPLRGREAEGCRSCRAPLEETLRRGGPVAMRKKPKGKKYRNLSARGEVVYYEREWKKDRF